MDYQLSCLAAYNYNPDAAVCYNALLELICLESMVTATPCDGQEAFADAVRRLRLAFEVSCAGSGSSLVFAGFFTVILMTCVNLIHWFYVCVAVGRV